MTVLEQKEELAAQVVSSHQRQRTALKYWLQGRGYYRAVKAIGFAEHHHQGIRKDGVTPEFAHQIFIAHYLRTLPIPEHMLEDVLTTALLHDVAEDYDIDPGEIEQVFGQVVGEAVWTLTKVFCGDHKPTDVYFQVISHNPVAAIVKGADRIHNHQTMPGVFTREKQVAYLAETEDWIIPMLKRARLEFPEHEASLENIRVMLKSQVSLIRRILDAGGQ